MHRLTMYCFARTNVCRRYRAGSEEGDIIYDAYFFLGVNYFYFRYKLLGMNIVFFNLLPLVLIRVSMVIAINVTDIRFLPTIVSTSSSSNCRARSRQPNTNHTNQTPTKHQPSPTTNSNPIKQIKANHILD